VVHPVEGVEGWIPLLAVMAEQLHKGLLAEMAEARLPVGVVGVQVALAVPAARTVVQVALAFQILLQDLHLTMVAVAVAAPIMVHLQEQVVQEMVETVELAQEQPQLMQLQIPEAVEAVEAVMARLIRVALVALEWLYYQFLLHFIPEM
jgi:hypothetical protein